MIEVQGTEALTKRLLEMGADAPKAATRAINRTLSSVRTASVRALARNTGLRNSDVAPAISTRRATFSRQIGELGVTGKRIPLIAFRARQTSRGVSYSLPGGRGSLPSGFIATMPGGHRGVFVRRGKKRKPIVEQFGPSLPRAFVHAGISAQMTRLANDLLDRNLVHEIDWIAQQRVQGGDE